MMPTTAPTLETTGSPPTFSLYMRSAASSIVASSPTLMTFTCMMSLTLSFESSVVTS